MADEVGKKHHNNFEIKRNVFRKAFGNKIQTDKTTQTPKKRTKAPQKQPTNQPAALLFTKSSHIWVPGGAVCAFPSECCHWSPAQSSVSEDGVPGMGVGHICQETATDGSTH